MYTCLYRYEKRSQMSINIYRNPKTLEIGSGTKLLFTLLSLKVFRHEERETISFYADFSIWTPARAAPPPQTTSLASVSSENRLSLSKPKSQLTAFILIPQILSASGHDVIHVPGQISYLGFLLWHLWLSHPPRAHVNTHTQLTHALTNPCTN